MRDLMAPDVVYEETGTGRRYEGVEAVMDALVQWKAAFPDAAGDIARVLIEDDTAVLEICWRGTHTGPLRTAAQVIPASNQPIEVWATAWQRWSGGRLVAERHHIDGLAMLVQIGAVPAPAH
jgi:steroid delta-isomerase-like uncharacterized protein